MWRGDPATPPESEREIAVVHRPKYDDWSLPKGKVDAGEQLVVTARREVCEETGVDRRLRSGRRRAALPGRRRPEVRPLLGDGRRDTAHSRRRTKSTSWWLPEAAAAQALLRHDRRLLNWFANMPMATATILLVRHAARAERSAGRATTRCGRWTRRAGARRAADRVARATSPSGSLSADLVRCCRHPSRPLPCSACRRHGADARQDAAGNDSPGRGRLGARLLAEGRPAMLCSQGEVIPDLIRWPPRRRVRLDVHAPQGQRVGAVVRRRSAGGRGLPTGPRARRFRVARPRPHTLPGMRATVLHAPKDVRLETVEDPKLLTSTDAVVRVVRRLRLRQRPVALPRRSTHVDRAAAHRARVRRRRRGGRLRGRHACGPATSSSRRSCTPTAPACTAGTASRRRCSHGGFWGGTTATADRSTAARASTCGSRWPTARSSRPRGRPTTR